MFGCMKGLNAIAAYFGEGEKYFTTLVFGSARPRKACFSLKGNEKKPVFQLT